MKIILAQGNPGPNYAQTRHNVGFMVLDALAYKSNVQFIEKSRYGILSAEVSIAGEKVLLIKPTTFYNDTGLAARKLVDFYKINPTNDLLVIHDDLALPFGTIRVRGGGSDGGNNGIKSLNNHIGPYYNRVRIGILNEFRDHANDADFVLSKFSSIESKALKDSLIPHTIELIEQFSAGHVNHTSYSVISK